MRPQRAYALTESSEIGVARRAAVELGRELGMDETVQGRLGIVASELATNVVKHGRQGELVVRPVEEQGRYAVELLALDSGPGIADVGRALEDGYSTAGTAGGGLGAVHRMASSFDVYSIAGAGTAMVARVWAGEAPASPTFQVGVVSLPMPGEAVCGDSWAVAGDEARIVAMVVDGLGHGALAADAARQAERTFHQWTSLPVAELLERLHGALAHTRGAAAAVAEMQLRAGVVKFAGIGNISASLHGRSGSRSMVSQGGIVGADVRRIQVFSYPFPPDTVFVAHSDGLSSRWELDARLRARHPSVVAGTLYRRAARGSDDATVLVIRPGEEPR